MIVLRAWLPLALLFGVCAAAPTAIATDGGLEEAFTDGEAHVNFRYRYEGVDQDPFSADANASTLRLRLNYRTGKWMSWSGFVEFDHIAEAFAEDFDSGAGTTPGRTRFPVVADPKGSDLNQVYLQADPNEDWQVRLGRQRILLDNHRFVGNVGWRQNEQTYDSVSATYSGFDKVKVFYAFVGNVNRIFGNDVAGGDHKQDTHLLNAQVMVNDQWKLVAYAYLIDNDDAPAFSTSTFGARITGNLRPGDGTLQLHAELAQQSDAGNGPVDYDAGYLRLDGAWSFAKNWSVGAGFELLEGDANNTGEAFRTPLATLHAFNGWADQFLTTPAQGLEDLFVSGGFNAAPWKADVIYHDLSAESGGGDFGSELDIAVSRGFGKRYKLLAKLASFDADAPGFVDTTKFWLMFTANY